MRALVGASLADARAFGRLTAGGFGRLTAGRFDGLTAGGFDGLTGSGLRKRSPYKTQKGRW